MSHDTCMTSEILQSDCTLPIVLAVPRKSTRVPRPPFPPVGGVVWERDYIRGADASSCLLGRRLEDVPEILQSCRKA